MVSAWCAACRDPPGDAVIGILAALLVVAASASASSAWRARLAARTRRRFGAPTTVSVKSERRVRAPATLRAWVEGSGVALDIDAAWMLWIVGTVLGTAALGVTAGPGAAVLLAAVLVGGPAVALFWNERRRRRRVGHALPGALDEIARSLRAGASLVQAIDDAARTTPGPIGDDLFGVVAAHRSGVPLADGLARWRTTRPLPGVRLTASALELGLAAGGTHARAVDGVAATLRDNLAISAEVRAQASQAQASALVIGLAPIGFTALACLADHRTASFLFQTPAGLACLAAGGALDAAGAMWMARITRTDA